MKAKALCCKPGTCSSLTVCRRRCCQHAAWRLWLASRRQGGGGRRHLCLCRLRNRSGRLPAARRSPLAAVQLPQPLADMRWWEASACRLLARALPPRRRSAATCSPLRRRRCSPASVAADRHNALKRGASGGGNWRQRQPRQRRRSGHLQPAATSQRCCPASAVAGRHEARGHLGSGDLEPRGISQPQ